MARRLFHSIARREGTPRLRENLRSTTFDHISSFEGFNGYGSRVALRPSALGVTATLVIWVVVPSELSRKSLKVVLVSVVGSISSEKVAVRVMLRSTPLCFVVRHYRLHHGGTLIDLDREGLGSFGVASLIGRVVVDHRRALDREGQRCGVLLVVSSIVSAVEDLVYTRAAARLRATAPLAARAHARGVTVSEA
jgi:hypothetical protein